MPCLYCRKMCCLNGSKKLHFVQKIRLDRIVACLGPDGFFARSAIFCRYWTCTFSCRNNQAIGAEVVCNFHLSLMTADEVSFRHCFLPFEIIVIVVFILFGNLLLQEGEDVFYGLILQVAVFPFQCLTNPGGHESAPCLFL